MDGTDGSNVVAKQSNLLTLLRVEPSDDQPGLFDEDSFSGASLVLAPLTGMSVPGKDDLTPCKASSTPDDWSEPEGYGRAAEICRSCPFMQWCATEALDHSASYHLVGVWATVDFNEEDRSGRYSRRIKKLEHIAATGALPRRRRPGRRPQQQQVRAASA